jgi:hypothetical protein
MIIKKKIKMINMEFDFNEHDDFSVRRVNEGDEEL